MNLSSATRVKASMLPTSSTNLETTAANSSFSPFSMNQQHSYLSRAQQQQQILNPPQLSISPQLPPQPPQHQQHTKIRMALVNQQQQPQQQQQQQNSPAPDYYSSADDDDV